MPNLEQTRQLCLELHDERAVVREPTAVQHALNACQKARAVAHVGPANMERLWKRRFPSEDGQIAEIFLITHWLVSSVQPWLVPRRPVRQRVGRLPRPRRRPRWSARRFADNSTQSLRYR